MWDDAGICWEYRIRARGGGLVRLLCAAGLQCWTSKRSCSFHFFKLEEQADKLECSKKRESFVSSHNAVFLFQVTETTDTSDGLA